jgi:hypothetical protein
MQRRAGLLGVRHAVSPANDDGLAVRPDHEACNG